MGGAACGTLRRPHGGARVDKLPWRVLGIFLLAFSIGVASCQALFSSLPSPQHTPAGQQLPR